MNRQRYEERRKEARARQIESDKLSPKQRLINLDRKYGKGKGAKRERTRLLAQIEAAKQAKEEKQQQTK